MKFLVTKEWQHAPFLKMLMGGVTLFMMLFLLTDLLLHYYQTGLSPSQAAQTLFGNEAEFIDPLPLGTLLLWIHIDLFAGMLSVLILSAIAIRLGKTPKRYAIAYFLFFLIAVTSSGVALYLHEHGIGLPSLKTPEGFLEIVVPHLFAMGVTAFVAAHFLLFVEAYTLFVKRTLFGVLLGLILLDQSIYLLMWIGWEVVGWVKPLAVACVALSWAVLAWAVAVAL